MDYGTYAPYIFAAYGASMIAIGGLILWRFNAHRKAKAAERKSVSP